MPKPTHTPALYEAGHAAQRAGKPRASCPYTKGASRASHERREWLRGYDDARHGGTQSPAGEPEPEPLAKAAIAAQLRNTNRLELWIRAELAEHEIPPTLPSAGIPDVGIEELPPGVQYG